MSNETGLTDVEDEIRDVLGNYCRAIDSGDIEGWASVFHPEAVWVGPKRRTRVGRDDIVDFLRETGAETHRAHVTLNTKLIEINEDEFRVQSDWFKVEKDTPLVRSIVMMGIYRDVLVRHEGRLVILRREATLSEAGTIEIGPDSRLMSPGFNL